MKTYVVRIHFAENVHGAPREFTHEISAVASSHDEAIRLGLEYFEQLGRDSWVGWIRTIGKVEVEPVSSGQMRRSGRAMVMAKRKPSEIGG